MEELSVSVIINTHNRANHLKRLLDCLTRQTYSNFEVIVVNGPSTDNTASVMEQYSTAIRMANCCEVNLCMSRNIGVKEAAGEILVFIDDDAVPGNNRWLEELCRPFRDCRIGVVGGQSYRMNGIHEFSKGNFSIWGESKSVTAMSLPKSEQDVGRFNGVIGCNCAFRRSVVANIGGFDEYYVYYLDETDLCYRIEKAGYRVMHNDAALVYHEAAGGTNRKSNFHLNWRTIARSLSYFVVKATQDYGLTQEQQRKKALEACDQWKGYFNELVANKHITKEDCAGFNEAVAEGRDEGMEAAFTTERLIKHDLKTPAGRFKLFDKTVADGHLNICFYCEDDTINPIGGVATYTKALALGLTKRGNNVYIITAGQKESISNIDGVNYCYVPVVPLQIPEVASLPTSQRRLAFSYACFTKLQILKKCFYIDIVESPIWDSYGLITSYLEKSVPLAVRLQTPLKMVLNTFHKDVSPDLMLLMEYEEAMLKRADCIIKISDCIQETIEELYGFNFEQPVLKNYLGFNPEVKALSQRGNDGKLVVFFIGRLERRKGIDSILAAIPELMNKYPNLEVRLAGDCNIADDVIGDTYKNKFLKDNCSAPWLKKVHFLGKISDKEKEQEYADCDIFVSPSLYESFGIIFVEAMRHSKPVIGCNIGGMKELIADGKTGLLCEPGNTESFKNCLDKLLAEPELRKTMGKAGRVRMLNMFSESVMCARCEDIYRDMLRSNYVRER